jgi:hypothetical protein
LDVAVAWVETSAAEISGPAEEVTTTMTETGIMSLEIYATEYIDLEAVRANLSGGIETCETTEILIGESGTTADLRGETRNHGGTTPIKAPLATNRACEA